jgi:DNA-binding response OmpR family regulator
MSKTKTKARILVIDDSEIILDQVAMTLEDAGYQVDTLTNVFHVPRLFKSALPDVILLDVKMPGLRGDTAASILTDYRFLEKSLVLLHSDLDEGALTRLVRKTGAGGFVRKSLNNEDLVGKIEEALAAAQAKITSKGPSFLAIPGSEDPA